MEPDRICLRRNTKAAPARHPFGGDHRFDGGTFPCNPRRALADRCGTEGDLSTDRAGILSLCDFGLVRCARKWPERADEPSGADSELSEKRPSGTAPSAWFARQTLGATNRHGVVVVV